MTSSQIVRPPSPNSALYTARCAVLHEPLRASRDLPIDVPLHVSCTRYECRSRKMLMHALADAVQALRQTPS